MTRPAHQMAGLDLQNGWRVERPVTPFRGATGGSFSTGYLVRHADGRQAYLKAIDYESAFQASDVARALQSLTEAFNFERDIADACTESRMSHVVRSIAHGEIDVPGGFPIPRVSYLIFELADGDLRKYMTIAGTIDAAWALRTLHCAAIGLQQLHHAGIAHQDLKPSNVMTFPSEAVKIGDLGRASVRRKACPYDNLSVAGDTGYAAPEGMYGFQLQDWDARRRAVDLYHLGSLLSFQFTGVAATPLLVTRLHPSQRPGQWQGTYDDILPVLRSAAGEVALKLPQFGEAVIDEELRQRFLELCEPDPRLRGHPRNRSARYASSYGLERYVSSFNLLACRARRHAMRLVSP